LLVLARSLHCSGDEGRIHCSGAEGGWLHSCRACRVFGFTPRESTVAQLTASQLKAVGFSDVWQLRDCFIALDYNEAGLPSRSAGFEAMGLNDAHFTALALKAVSFRPMQLMACYALAELRPAMPWS